MRRVVQYRVSMLLFAIVPTIVSAEDASIPGKITTPYPTSSANCPTGRGLVQWFVSRCHREFVENDASQHQPVADAVPKGGSSVLYVNGSPVLVEVYHDKRTHWTIDMKMLFNAEHPNNGSIVHVHIVWLRERTGHDVRK